MVKCKKVSIRFNEGFFSHAPVIEHTALASKGIDWFEVSRDMEFLTLKAKNSKQVLIAQYEISLDSIQEYTIEDVLNIHTFSALDGSLNGVGK